MKFTWQNVLLILAYNCIGGYLIWHYLTLPLISQVNQALASAL